jgi:hypothetical protein
MKNTRQIVSVFPWHGMAVHAAHALAATDTNMGVLPRRVAMRRLDPGDKKERKGGE